MASDTMPASEFEGKLEAMVDTRVLLISISPPRDRGSPRGGLSSNVEHGDMGEKFEAGDRVRIVGELIAVYEVYRVVAEPNLPPGTVMIKHETGALIYVDERDLVRVVNDTKVDE